MEVSSYKHHKEYKFQKWRHYLQPSEYNRPWTRALGGLLYYLHTAFLYVKIHLQVFRGYVTQLKLS